MPTEGEVSVGAVVAQAELDTTPAESAMSQLMNKLVEIGGRATAGNTGFVSWGTTASRAIGNVSNNLSALNRTFGESAPLSALTTTLEGMSLGFQNLANREKDAEGAGRKFVALGPALQGLGTIAIGLGGAFTAIATPLQHAQAELQVAIQNTGRSVSDYQDRMGAAASAGAKFGFTQSDVQKALAELTVETKNPDEALRELTMTETLAAARHTDLGHAARYMGQAHAGMFRVFRQFGIEIQQVKNPEKELESAHKALGTAADELKTKEQSLNDFEARAAEDLQKRQDAAAQKVQSTQSAMSDAEQRYSDLQETLQQREQDRITSTAQAAEDAAQRRVEADQRVADLEATLDGNSAKAQDDKEALANAESRMNMDRVRVAQTSGAAQQSAIQQLASSEAEYHKLKRDQAEQQKKDQQDLTKAKLDDARAATDVQKTARAAAQAQKGLTPAEQMELNRAQEAQVKTAREYQRALQDQQAAQSLTLSQQQEQARLEGAVASAKDKVVTATDKVTKAQDDQNTANASFAKLEQEFMQREGGLLDARAKTWTGHVATIKAHIVDLFQTIASHSAGIVTSIGGTAIALGTIIDLGRRVRGRAARAPGGPAEAAAGETEATTEEVSKAQGAFDPLARGAKKAGDDVREGLKGVPKAVEETESEVGGRVGRITGIFGRIGGVVKGIPAGFSAMAGGVRAAMTGMIGFITSPVGLIILAIGALILIGVEVVTHWKTISHDLAMAWDAMFAVGKRVFGDIESVVKIAFGFVKAHFIEIAAFIVGGPFGLAIAYIATHWKQVWDTMVKVGHDAKNLILTIIKGLVDGVLTGIEDLLKGLGHLPGPFGSPFRNAAKHVDTFKQTVNKTLDDLKNDGQRKGKEAGEAMGKGLSDGIDSATNSVKDAGSKLSQNAASGARAHAEISSPSALFAREIGHPIALGMAQGISRGADAVQRATRAMMMGARMGATGAGQTFQPPVGVIPTRTVHVGGPTENNQELGAGGRKPTEVIHYEPHFYREIDPQHVLHEFVWRDVNA